MKISDLPAPTLEKIAHLIGGTQGVDPDADLPTVNGYNVLCLQYVRPEKVGSIILASQTLKEDAHQGRVGIVLALGPDAYADETKFPAGPWVAVGDVVAWPALENASGRYPFGGQTLAVVPDDRLMLKGCNLRLMVGR